MMNNNTFSAVVVNIGWIVSMIGGCSLLGITIYYMWKVSAKRKLTQKEFNKAIILTIITSFIAGVGMVFLLVMTIDESATLTLRLLLSTVICIGCLVLWPLFMVGGFIWEFKRKNLVQKN
jgi:uncharacterized membrane protein